MDPVDQWSGTERLVALDWTEVAIALPVRHVHKLRLIDNVFPAMLEQMPLGEVARFV